MASWEIVVGQSVIAESSESEQGPCQERILRSLRRGDRGAYCPGQKRTILGQR